MERNSTSPSRTTGWIYTELSVRDGSRVLKPTHVCADEIAFGDPPCLQSSEIGITIKNGDRQTTRIARVLLHEPSATRIPIQLVGAQQKASAKRIA